MLALFLEFSFFKAYRAFLLFRFSLMKFFSAIYTFKPFCTAFFTGFDVNIIEMITMFTGPCYVWTAWDWFTASFTEDIFYRIETPTILTWPN
jgi:hypothetical protein